MTTQADTGFRRPKPRKAPEAGRGQEGPSPRALAGAWPCRHLVLGFWTPDPRKNTFLLFSATNFVVIVMAAPGNYHHHLGMGHVILQTVRQGQMLPYFSSKLHTYNLHTLGFLSWLSPHMPDRRRRRLSYHSHSLMGLVLLLSLFHRGDYAVCRLSHLLRDARLGRLSGFHVHNITLSFLPVPLPCSGAQCLDQGGMEMTGPWSFKEEPKLSSKQASGRLCCC